jgi:hypothetical protein
MKTVRLAGLRHDLYASLKTAAIEAAKQSKQSLVTVDCITEHADKVGATYRRQGTKMPSYGHKRFRVPTRHSQLFGSQSILVQTGATCYSSHSTLHHDHQITDPEHAVISTTPCCQLHLATFPPGSPRDRRRACTNVGTCGDADGRSGGLTSPLRYLHTGKGLRRPTQARLYTECPA